MSGVVIWYEHECPGWSFDVSTNVRVVIWCEHECPGWSFDVSTNVRPCQKSRGNECPWERMSGILFATIHNASFLAFTMFIEIFSFKMTLRKCVTLVGLMYTSSQSFGLSVKLLFFNSDYSIGYSFSVYVVAAKHYVFWWTHCHCCFYWWCSVCCCCSSCC